LPSFASPRRFSVRYGQGCRKSCESLRPFVQTYPKKIALPSYNALASLIVDGVGLHQRTLTQIIDGCLTEGQRGKLDKLLEKEPGGTNAEEGWRYRITLLKKPYQSTRPSKVKANLADLDILQAHYLELKPVVDRLGLSYECIRHYAYAVIKSQVAQISRRADEPRYLYLIAFVIYQTFKLNDTLIDTLLLATQAAVNAAEKAHKEAYYQERPPRPKRKFACDPILPLDLHRFNGRFQSKAAIRT